MPTIHTTIEIAAPPSTVRAIFLDFPSHPTWHTSFLQSITPKSPSPSRDSSSLTPGSTLAITLSLSTRTYTMAPILLTNTPREFTWVGKLFNIPGLFTGEHSFKFLDSEDPGNVGGTRFEQAEVFSGVAAGVMREAGGMYRETKGGFEGFNGDLKGRCERGM